MRRRTSKAARLAALAVALTAAASCSREQAAPRAEPREAHAPSDAAPRPTGDGPRVVFEPEGGERAQVAVELAETPAAIERGLMYRQHLPPDRGMLFIFPDEALRTFWMKNTLIPLDMIFISSEREVVGVVENAEPQTATPRRVDAPSQYVVEVNAGWARRHGVEAGTDVRFIDVDAR